MKTSCEGKHAESGYSEREGKVLRELIRTLREIRYGSVVLTVHDGRVMEIHKTEKIRMTDPHPRDS